MPQGFEEGDAKEVGHIVLSAREIVVHAQDIMSFVQESLTQMRAEKSGPARYQNPSHSLAPIPGSSGVLLGAPFGRNQNQLAQRRRDAEKTRNKTKIQIHFELCVPASPRET
jgi:hypothetical protein